MSRSKKSSEVAKETIGYIRVSTQEQVESGFSLQAQEERIRAYAVATARVLSRVVVDDGKSAKSLDRPGLQGILKDIKNGRVSSVIVLKLDRLTRSVRDLGELVDMFQASNVDLIAVSEALDTSSASGRMVMNLMATVSQWEREVIGERTATVLTHMRSKKQVYGKTPMGYKRDGDNLVEDHEEQLILQNMKMRVKRGESYSSIATWLNAEGVPPRQGGKRWYTASVQRVLKSRMSQEG
jgi:DNA invertase Pin-like site-specific DNA recombinase